MFVCDVHVFACWISLEINTHVLWILHMCIIILKEMTRVKTNVSRGLFVSRVWSRWMDTWKFFSPPSYHPFHVSHWGAYPYWQCCSCTFVPWATHSCLSWHFIPRCVFSPTRTRSCLWSPATYSTKTGLWIYHQRRTVSPQSSLQAFTWFSQAIDVVWLYSSIQTLATFRRHRWPCSCLILWLEVFYNQMSYLVQRLLVTLYNSYIIYITWWSALVLPTQPFEARRAGYLQEKWTFGPQWLRISPFGQKEKRAW